MYVISLGMSKLTMGLFAGVVASAALGGWLWARSSAERFVTIPTGVYQLGSPEAEGGTHDVHTAGFRIQATEVTVGQFLRYLRAARPAERYDSPQIVWDGRRYQPLVRRDLPVTHVDLGQAAAYAAWRGARLPTSDEWEMAARGAYPGVRYPWGWHDPAGRAQWDANGPTPVGSFEPNALGLYDMAGNVAEWSVAPVGAMPMALGGSWSERHLDLLRVFQRTSFPAAYRDADVGFRIVKD